MSATPTSTMTFERGGKTWIRLTYICMLCDQPNAVEVLYEEYTAWRDGGSLIQQAFPNTSPADREVMLSGSHGKCFEELVEEAFPEEDEESDCAHDGIECDDEDCTCDCVECAT